MKINSILSLFGHPLRVILKNVGSVLWEIRFCSCLESFLWVASIVGWFLVNSHIIDFVGSFETFLVLCVFLGNILVSRLRRSYSCFWGVKRVSESVTKLDLLDRWRCTMWGCQVSYVWEICGSRHCHWLCRRSCDAKRRNYNSGCFKGI